MDGKDKFLFTIHNSMGDLDIISDIYDHEISKYEDEDGKEFNKSKHRYLILKIGKQKYYFQFTKLKTSTKDHSLSHHSIHLNI